ncbi:14815_t:CDS:2, partial [Cetraspora pellucida]
NLYALNERSEQRSKEEQHSKLFSREYPSLQSGHGDASGFWLPEWFAVKGLGRTRTGSAELLGIVFSCIVDINPDNSDVSPVPTYFCLREPL